MSQVETQAPDPLNPFIYGHDPFLCGADCDGTSCGGTDDFLSQVSTSSPTPSFEETFPSISYFTFRTEAQQIDTDVTVYVHSPSRSR